MAGGRGSAGQVLGDERRVAADAVDEVRSAKVLEALPQHIETGPRRHAPPLADLAGIVQDGDLQPRIAAPVPGRPDDRADAEGAEMEPIEPRGGPEGPHRLGWEHLRGEARIVDVTVDVGEHAAHALVGFGGGVRQISRQRDVVAVDPGQASGESHARVLQRGEIECSPVRVADELEGRFAAGPDRIGPLADGLVEVAGAVEPPVLRRLTPLADGLVEVADALQPP